MTSKDGKRILGVLNDLIIKLDSALPKCQNVKDLFSPDLNFYRMRCRDYSNRLFNLDPVAQGEKAVDIYWKKVIYETLSVARKLQKGWTIMEKSYVQSHLMSGLGHLTDVLLRLHEIGLESREVEVINFLRKANPDFAPSRVHQENVFSDSQTFSGYESQDQLLDWLKRLIGRCLMYLGDICRYMSEFEEAKANHARRYYHQAILLDASQGLPFNQLASLATNMDYGLTSVVFYLKSILCKKPFEGGEQNLKRLLQKNQEFYLKLIEDISDNSDLNVLCPKSEKHRCIVFSLEMINLFLFEKASDAELSQMCQMTLQTVQHCLYLHLEHKESHEVLLPSEIASNIMLSLILLLKLLKERDSKTLSSLLRAYLWALFSHLVTKFLADLHVNLYGHESLTELFKTPEAIEETNEETNQAEESRSPSPGSKSESRKVKGLERFKRKRRTSRCSESLSEGSFKQDDSSTEYESDLERSQPNDSENEDREDEFLADALYSDSNSEEGFTSTDDDVVIESSRNVLTTKQIIKFVNNYDLFNAIRLGSIWLMESIEMVKEGAKSTSILWTRLAKLFQLISLKNENYESVPEVTEAIEKLESKLSKLKIPEDFDSDVILQRFPENSNNFFSIENFPEVEQGVIKIWRLERFKRFLSKIPETGLNLDFPSTFEFSADPDLDTHEDNSTSEGDSASKETSKKKLMENMAQLWLEHEVCDLEGKGSRHRGTIRGFAHYTPYLVIDHLALSKHLKLVQKIVESKKFAVIIPIEAIQQLDDMKKLEGKVRIAIRWLEREFEKGNRWLRTQKPHETRSIEQLTQPKKKDRESWQRLRIFECCHHFALVRGEDVSSDTAQVTLLTSESSEPGAKDIANANGLAALFNVKVEMIENFVKSPRKEKNSMIKRRNKKQHHSAGERDE